MTEMELKGALEAILYVAEDPVPLDQLREAFPEIAPAMLQETLDRLEAEYSAAGRGILLRLVAGGYRLSTRVDYHEHVRRFLKAKPGVKLSMAALETLAIIAYKQPVTVPEIMQIRGVKSAGAIKTLLEKKLIAARGRKKVVGSPMTYGTSKDFLVHFGLSSLRDLPTLEEFEEIFGDKADRAKQKDLFERKLAGVASSAGATPPTDDAGGEDDFLPKAQVVLEAAGTDTSLFEE